MSYERTITRYGHGNGYTNVCYAAEDETIVSAGYDGDIHVWNGIEDDDPSTGCTGEFIASVAFHDNKVYVGTDVNTVQLLTYPDLDRDGTKYRFTAVATAIKVNDKYVAAGSEDTNIKVYLNDEEKVVELLGHNGPILSLDITSGNGNGWLVSASGDGSVRVWDIVEQKVIKSIDGYPKVKSFEMAECYVTPSFSPSDDDQPPKYLACANPKGVTVYETKTWSIFLSLTDAKLKGSFTVCAFSCCGKFVAAGTSKGELVVWAVADGKRVDGKAEGESDEPITSLNWNPNGPKQFVYADKSGQIGCVNVDTGMADKSGPADKALNVNGVDEINGNVQFDDGDDEDDDNCVSLDKLKNETMRNAGLDPEGNYLDDDDSNSRGFPPVPSRAAASTAPSLKLCTQQKPFQPGATPMHLEHRYMVWNGVGIVRCHNTDAENSIEAEFHDVSMHHGIHMSNFLNHTLASLSSTVLALAGGEQCKLVCIALGAGSREWSASLPNCEEIVALTASEKLVAVGTDNRFVRIFSYMGNQREVLCVPGVIVAMASHQNKLMVVFHSGISEEEQVLSCMLVEAFGLSLRSRTVTLPITPRAKLTWVGYSDKGSPVTQDSFGLIRSFKNNIWFPICDTTQHARGASDQFFIIDVSEAKQVIQAVHCRGASFPSTHPRPMVSELAMRMPLCEIETEKSQWEDDLIRSSVFAVDSADKQGQGAALKLFALACRSEIEMRARDLIEMIGSPALVPLAAKYANKLGRIHLAEKLSEMMPRVLEMEREREREVEMEYVEEQAAVAATNLVSITPSSAVVSSPAVVLAPKLIKPGAGRRNPFKRSVGGGSSSASSSPNPIKHLTDSIVGLPSNDLFASKNFEDEEKVEGGGDSEKLTPTPKPSAAKKPFFEWFSERKAELLAEMPDGSNPSELTSFAMKKYKQVHAANGNETPTTTGKRKLEEKENEGSGIAKLAKFRLEA